MPLGLSHNLPVHQPSTLSTEFWQPTNFAIHPSFNPALIPQNLIPHYKLPNFQTLLSQYMGLNNLSGIFGYPQSLATTIQSQISPQCSPNGSPPTTTPSKSEE